MSRGKRQHSGAAQSAICFLDPASAEAPYRRLLRGGSSLQAAICAAQMRAHYTEEKSLARLAAATLCAVSQTHALIDGNKRAAICLTDEFLSLNGAHIMGQDVDICALVWDVASGRIDEAGAYLRLRDLVASGVPTQDFATRYPHVIENLAA